MSTKFVFLSILFLTLLLIPLNYSLAQRQEQNKPPDAATLFDLAAARYKGELEGLFQMRGGGGRRIRDVSSKDIARVLATGTEGNSSEAGYAEKTAVLFYSYEQGVLHIWLVDERGVRAYNRRKLTARQIEKAILNLRNSLDVDSLQLSRTPRLRRVKIVRSNAPRLSVNRAITNLTNILIPTAIANALVSVRHLVVVPILGLGTVPYPVLKPFASNVALIDKMSISVAPSLIDIGQDIGRWNPRFLSPLIIGNPYLPSSAQWVVPPLPGAEKEAQEVARAVGAKPLLGRDATKQAVLLTAPRSDFLYFATHGIASSDQPLSRGFLMLSASEFEKGWLTAEEIQRMNFGGAQIAVLSACQTGLGRVHEAGIIGLARAFQIAGVPRVIMSLWSVNDQATNELMQAFIRNMQTSIPSEALRLAMLEVRKSRPKPSQWASFILFGTPR